MVRRRLPGRVPERARVLLVALLLVLGTTSATALHTLDQAAAAVPAGFSEVVVWSGLVNPMAVRFAPDGRVFVAEKRGTIQMFDGLSDPTPTLVADLRTEVHNYWDRGLSGLAVDPQFPTRPYLYALYTYDGAIGETAPRWGTAGEDSDPCPTPPGPTTNGCVASAKLVRLTLDGSTTTQDDLIHDWCQQFNGHTADDLVFGADGALYASAGESAKTTLTDYGQFGDPVNPCGDPPGGVGGSMTAPSAEGGSLRSQDLRTAGDPVGLDGTVIRIDPDTGDARPDNPNAAAADPNARRIVASGLRNPYRMTVRPGTNELWIADVGWNTFDEVDRHPDPTAAVRNFGWPCYEGVGRQPSWDATNVAVCENLYATPTAVTDPYFSYRHDQPVNGVDTCASAGGTSSSGIAFLADPDSPYPAEYDGALFLADYSRDCIWVMPAGAGGLPDASAVRPFVVGASGPVDLQISPDGELVYPDIEGGTVRRIAYGTAPTSCPAGQLLAEYFPGGTPAGMPALVACEPEPLDHQWGTGGPGTVGPDDFSARWTGTFALPSADTWTFTAVTDGGIRVRVDGQPLIDEWRDQPATTFTAVRALEAGTHALTVEWFDTGGPATARLDWSNGPADGVPVPEITTPAVGTTWAVGQAIPFSGSATDAEDGALTAEALSWELVMQHCPNACHAHPVQTFSGVSAGSFVAPDHEYPSYLELRLTATDSAGRATTVIRRLDARTVGISVATQPAGLTATLGARTATAPFTVPVIAGSTIGLSAPSPQALNGATYAFARWSDGGAPTHLVPAGTTDRTYIATYTPTTCPQRQFRAQYFANTTLSGVAAVVRCEASPLNRNWGSGGPGAVGVNNFSARWTGAFTFPGGTVTFTAASNDGIRVWVDGVRIINRWASAGTSTVRRAVSAGVHTIRVDYVERTGTAFARVTW